MNYSKVLKELRSKLLLSQSELAELLEVSYLSINRWENGKTTPIYSARRKIRELCVKNDIMIEEVEDNE